MTDTGCESNADSASDYDLALKFFLRASEMETDPQHLELYKTNSRTWWGVKLVRD
jgi:hypothetical protein